MFQRLLRMLPKDKAELLEGYAKACRTIDGLRSDQPENEWHRRSREFVEAMDAGLPSLLGKQEAQRFHRHIAPYLRNSYDSRYRETFSIELFQRLILRRVLELGWKTERFGNLTSEFILADETRVNRNG